MPNPFKRLLKSFKRKSTTPTANSPPNPSSQQNGVGNTEAPDVPKDPLECLREYDTILIIDDSSCMNNWSAAMSHASEKNLWQQVQDLVKELVPSVTKYAAEGIEIVFLNHKTGIRNCKGFNTFNRTFELVRPQGDPPLGTILWKHLEDYLAQLKTDNLPKPRNYIVLTVGYPGPPREKELVMSTILHTSQLLHEHNCATFQCKCCQGKHRQLGIQFVQLGTTKDATHFLNELDTIAAKTETGAAHPDFIDTKPYNNTPAGITAETLMEMVRGGIMDTYDSDKPGDQAQLKSATAFRPDPFPASAVVQHSVYHPSNLLTPAILSDHDLYQKQQAQLAEVWKYWQRWHSCMHRQKTHVDSDSKSRYIGGFLMDEPPLVAGCWTRQPDRSWKRDGDCLGPPPVSDMFEIMLKDKEWCQENFASGI
ncbi:hypothetical protein DFH06DRAFT_101448 [Mycena polygramma]|nr:hypothetical protein DFH06DRAFT_101448 [Mycena polygramma]